VIRLRRQEKPVAPFSLNGFSHRTKDLPPWPVPVKQNGHFVTSLFVGTFARIAG